jgi:hypothetical protein
MFVKGFDRYACVDERITCEVDGFKVTARIERDDHTGAPWKEHDGHGPVSDWTRRAKRPGERVLNDDRGSKRFYDFAEAVRIARRDGWGGEGRTAGMRAADAAERDFKALQAWCNDDWFWCGIVLSVEKAGVDLIDEYAVALWGIECNYPGSQNAYLTEVANDLLPQALDLAREKIAELCDCEEC